MVEQQVKIALRKAHHKQEFASLLTHAIRCSMHQQKMQKDKQKQQQPACWYNNVCSQFVVDATLTINNKI